MTKAQYQHFKEKDQTFLTKAKLFYGLYILIGLALLVLMFVFQIVTYFLTFFLILCLMGALYQFVFKEYILFVLKQREIARIDLHHVFKVSKDVVDYFDENLYQSLYEKDYTLLQKNDVFVIATKPLEESIHDLALATYFIDLKTEAICPSIRDLSREISSYLIQASVVKVIVLVSETFTDEDKEILKYNAQAHKNTVVLGIEKSSSSLYYNYFLNGETLDVYLSDLFQVNLTIKGGNNK